MVAFRQILKQTVHTSKVLYRYLNFTILIWYLKSKVICIFKPLIGFTNCQFNCLLRPPPMDINNDFHTLSYLDVPLFHYSV